MNCPLSTLDLRVEKLEARVSLRAI